MQLNSLYLYYLVHVKVQNNPTMFILFIFDNFESNQRYVQKSVKVATMQQILQVAFNDNVIFNFHDGWDKSDRQFGNGGNAKLDLARSWDVASLIRFVYISFAQSVINAISHLVTFQQFLFLLVRLQVKDLLRCRYFSGLLDVSLIGFKIVNVDKVICRESGLPNDNEKNPCTCLKSNL